MRRDPYRGAATRRDRASLEEERWWLRLRDPALADYHKPSRGASATYGDQLVRPVASLIPRTGSALAAIAPLLGASDGGAALRTAYVAQQVALEPWLTRRSVATIAASLAGSLGAVDAVAVASKIDDTVVRSEALEAMARRMAALGRSAEAIAVARAVRDEWGRCELLAAVARELTVAGRPDDAMEAALAIEDELERLDTLSSIASSLRPRDIDRALRRLAEVASGWRRDGALAALAARAAELDDGETALSAVRQLADDWVRAGALESVADRLDATTIVSAIELARSLSDRTGHDLALAATASRAASLGQGDEALASARAITDAGCRAEALTAIAPSLGATADQSQALSEAIEAAMSLADPAHAAVLAAIAACAAQIGHSDENQAAVRWIGEEWWRERALASLSPRPWPATSGPSLHDALSAARGAEDAARRAKLLGMLLPFLDGQELGLALRDALEAAHTVGGDECSRAIALVAVSYNVSPTERERALRKALATATGGRRTPEHTLRRLSVYRRHDRGEEAIDVAQILHSLPDARSFRAIGAVTRPVSKSLP